MAKKYKPQEILDMAVGLIEKQPDADLNGDGKITAADAKIQLNMDNEPTVEDTSGESSLISEDILESIMKKSSGFSYDMNVDPVYKYYSDYYKREGQKNAENIMGLTSALTGGYGNSYGLTLAGKAISDASDKTFETGLQLEEKAYDRYRDSIDGLYDLLDAVKDSEDRETAKSKADIDFALKAAEKGDYSYLKKLGIDTTALTEGDAREKAEFLAKYGDYSHLKKLGIDTSSLTDSEAREKAEFLAKFGDYSGLSALGIDLTKLEKDELKEMAELFAKYGDYSLLGILGADTSHREEEDYYNRLILKGRYRNL